MTLNVFGLFSLKLDQLPQIKGVDSCRASKHLFNFSLGDDNDNSMIMINMITMRIGNIANNSKK